MARSSKEYADLISAFPVREFEEAQALVERALEGDTEAAERIVDEATSPSPAAMVWEMAVTMLGDVALPQVARALEQNPDNEDLVMALPLPISDGAVEVLAEVCRRTHSPEMARVVGGTLAHSDHARLPELRQIIEGRDDPMLAAGFRLGELGRQEEPDPQALLPYLQPGMPREMWSDAVMLSAGLNLPEATECVRRALGSAHPEDQMEGLHCVGAAGLGELLGEVLGIVANATSADMRGVAIGALEELADAGLADLPATMAALAEVAEACRRGAESFGYRLRSALERHGDVVTVAESVLYGIDNVRRLYRLCLGLGPESALAIPHVHGQLYMATMHLAAACTSEGLDLLALPLADSLVHTQLALLGHAQRAGVQHPRQLLLAAVGRYIFSVRSGPMSSREQEELAPWAEVLERLRRASLTLAEAQLAEHQDEDDPVAAECSLGWLFSWCARLKWEIAKAQEGKEAYRTEALGALRSSVQREHHARKAALRSLGASKLSTLLRIWAELPQACMEEDVADARAAAGIACPLSRQEFAAAAKLVCEHNLQCALLGVIGLIADASCVPLVIARLDSECDAVVDSASAVLVRAGAVAVPALLSAMDAAGDPVAHARLMEIVACIEPASALDRARSLLGSEDELLAATAARVVGLAGEPADATALAATASHGPELPRAMALRAIGQLDPDAHVALLRHAVCSPLAGVRRSAVFALGQCSEEVLAATIADFETQPDLWRRQALEDLADVEVWRDDHTRLTRGPSALPAPDQYPGARLLYADGDPWAWGLSNLTPGPAVDWERYRELLASDPVLTLAWDVYSDLGQLQADMIRLLVDIYVADDERATPALEVLWHVLRPELRAVLDAVCRYYELPGGENAARDERVQAALGRAVQSCTEEFVADLCDSPAAGQLQASEEEATDDEESSWSEVPRAGDTVAALCYQFARELSAAYGITLDALPQGDVERVAAMAAEWECLQEYSDERLGFLVQPRTTLEDLIWYCSQDVADAGTRRSVFSYLVLLAGYMPCPPEARERARAAVRDLVEPVLACAVQVLLQGGVAPTLEEAQECAEDVFADALAELKAASEGGSIIGTPQSTAMGAMLRAADDIVLASAGHHYPKLWAGFVHGLLERFDDFIVADGKTEVRAGGDATREPEVPGFSDLSALPTCVADCWLLGIDLGAETHPQDMAARRDALGHVLTACSRTVLYEGRRRSAVDTQSLTRMLSCSPEEVRQRVTTTAGEPVVIDGREYLLRRYGD